MAKKLENIVESTWDSIYDMIINTRKKISTIKKKHGLKNGLLCEYCFEATGYSPEELRVHMNIEAITKKLMSGKSVTQVQKYFNVSSTAFNKAFTSHYSMPAKQYVIEQKAKLAAKGHKMTCSGRGRVKGDLPKRSTDPKLDRYRVIVDRNKHLPDYDR
jgi:methylphosphotriester-DNA--protein-cysteine methyltransferase